MAPTLRILASTDFGASKLQMDADYDLAEITSRNDNAKRILATSPTWVAATAYGKWFNVCRPPA